MTECVYVAPHRIISQANFFDFIGSTAPHCRLPRDLWAFNIINETQPIILCAGMTMGGCNLTRVVAMITEYTTSQIAYLAVN